MIIRACDLETTGLDASAEVVEVAAHDVRDGQVYTTPYRTFVKPAAPIPPQASAVHHITDAHVADAPPWNDAWRILVDNSGLSESGVEIVFAAHVASFERQWLDNVISPRWICTWKASLRQWPDLDSHSLQALRYALNLEPADPAIAMPPHRAAPDAYVCGLLVLELLKHQTVETLIQWTAEPPLFTKFDFGQFDGKPLSAADDGYLDWLANKDHRMGDDWRWNAKREIDRRARAAEDKATADRKAYLDAALEAVPGAATLQDLENWYYGQSGAFAIHRILAGTDEYDALIAACAARKKVLLAAGRPLFEAEALSA